MQQASWLTLHHVFHPSFICPPCFLNFSVFSILSIPIRSDRLLRSTSPVWSWSEAEELPGLLPVTLAQQSEKFLTESGLEAMPLDYNQTAKVPHSAFIDFPELSVEELKNFTLNALSRLAVIPSGFSRRPICSWINFTLYLPLNKDQKGHTNITTLPSES